MLKNDAAIGKLTLSVGKDGQLQYFLSQLELESAPTIYCYKSTIARNNYIYLQQI
jgi:hypothetical protein